MRQFFGRQRPLPTTLVLSIKMCSSPKVLDLDDCFSRESPYHDQGDSLVDGSSVSAERALWRLLKHVLNLAFASALGKKAPKPPDAVNPLFLRKCTENGFTPHSER